MGYKCCKCSRNEVSSKYGICEECASRFIDIDVKPSTGTRSHGKNGTKSPAGSRPKTGVSGQDPDSGKLDTPFRNESPVRETLSSAEPRSESRRGASAGVCISEPPLGNQHGTGVSSGSTVSSPKPKNPKAPPPDKVSRVSPSEPEAPSAETFSSHIPEKTTKKPPAPPPETIYDYGSAQPLDTYGDTPDVLSSRNHVSGYVNNVTVHQDSPAFIVRYFRCLFMGTPLSFSGQVISFNVVFDRTGESVDIFGNRSVLVEVYGSSRQNSISQYNHVDVYGHRNHNNVMMANRVVNNDNGVSTTTFRLITPVVWLLTLVLILAMIFVFNRIGISGVVICLLVIFAVTNLRLVITIFGWIIRLIWRLISWLFGL